MNKTGFTSSTIITLCLLCRYMLVDNEDDNKTHRPVAPKDVSPRLTSSSNFISKRRCFITWLFSLGSKEAHPIPWQPGGDHKRWALSACEEGWDGGHEEDVRQPQARKEVPLSLMKSRSAVEQLSLVLFTLKLFMELIWSEVRHFLFLERGLLACKWLIFSILWPRSALV